MEGGSYRHQKLQAFAKLDMAFSGESQLKSHLHTHTEKPNLRQTGKKRKFDEQFFHTSNPKKHGSTPTDVSALLCEDAFSQKGRMQSYLAIHTKPCEVCSKRFFRDEQLQAHMLTHAGEFKPFVCEVCSKKFSRKRYLVVHLNNHTKKHACDVCGVSFSERAYLRMHTYLHRWKKK